MNWNNYNTDKESLHTYQAIYQSFFPTEESRRSVGSVLEIGVQRGGSMRLWADFFPEAEIHGIDNDRRTLPLARKINASHPRIHIHDVDASLSGNMEVWAYAEKLDGFDVIIDDGSHRMQDQEQALLFAAEYAKRLFVVEDLHTSRMNSRQYGIIPGRDTFLQLCEKYPDLKSIRPVSLTSDELKQVWEAFPSMEIHRGRVSEIAFFKTESK